MLQHPAFVALFPCRSSPPFRQLRGEQIYSLITDGPVAASRATAEKNWHNYGSENFSRSPKPTLGWHERNRKERREGREWNKGKWNHFSWAEVRYAYILLSFSNCYFLAFKKVSWMLFSAAAILTRACIHRTKGNWSTQSHTEQQLIIFYSLRFSVSSSQSFRPCHPSLAFAIGPDEVTYVNSAPVMLASIKPYAIQPATDWKQASFYGSRSLYCDRFVCVCLGSNGDPQDSRTGKARTVLTVPMFLT